MTLAVVILAAGHGKRMQSDLPKVLHILGAKPLLAHVADLAKQVSPNPPIVVYGFQGEQVKSHFSHENWLWAHQGEQLGTAHAVQQALAYLTPNQTHILVLYGDVPLIPLSVLQAFISHIPKSSVGIMTSILDQPFGYGRMVRNSKNEIIRIVEEKDANELEKKIQEINSGIYLFPSEFLKKTLPAIQSNNAQGERYLTDAIAKAVHDNIPIESMRVLEKDILGINSKSELAKAERIYQRRQADCFMENGVQLADPDRFDVRGVVSIEKNVFIDINVILSGNIKIGKGCRIGAHSILNQVELGENVEIQPFSHIDGAIIESHAKIGPFARIRPNSKIGQHAHIGNFVEIKNVHFGEGSKANHLSYLGDSNIGRWVNIGAGVITCNYDGAHKHQTQIEDDVFVGSNSALIAPVTIAKGGTIGAGSVITESTQEDQLTLARARQISIDGWQRPKKNK